MTDPDTTASTTPAAPDTSRTQIRGSALLLAGQAFAVAVNLVTQVLIVRYLSKTTFGAFAYALSLASLAETVAGFGLRRGVSRFVPIYEERGDPARAAGVLVLTAGIVGSLGLAVLLLGIGASGVLARPVEDEDVARLLIATVIVLAPVQALESLFDGVFAAFTRPRLILARRFVYTPVMRLAIVLVVVLADRGVQFLAAGYVAAGVLGLTVYSLLLVRVLRERQLLQVALERRLVTPARQLLRYTTPLLSNDVSAALLTAGSVVVLGALAGADEAAVFRAVLPISLTLTYVLSAFGTLFVPLASRLYARGSSAELSDLYWQTAGWTALLSFPVFAVAFAFGDPLAVLLFGADYEDGGTVLAVLVLGHFVTAALGPNGALLAVHRELRYIVLTNLLAAGTTLALLAVLVPPFGALGAAVSCSATLVLVNVVRQLGLASRTPVEAFDRRFLPLFAVLAALAAGLTVVDRVAGPPLALGCALVGAATAAAFLYARTVLAVGSTFPELARVPGLRRLIGDGGKGDA